MIFKSCQFWFTRLFCFVVGPNRQKKQNWGVFHFFSKCACVNAIRVSKYTPARTICNKSRLYSCLWTLGWYFCRKARAIVKSAPYQGTLECKMQETSCYIYTNNWTDLLEGIYRIQSRGLATGFWIMASKATSEPKSWEASFGTTLCRHIQKCWSTLPNN